MSVLTRTFLTLSLIFTLLGVSSCSSQEQKFSNPPYAQDSDKTLWDVIKWKLSSKPASWPDWIESTPQEVDFPEATNSLKATFINHATVLIHIDGVNILTDPIWSKRPSPVSFAGPKRIRDPGIKFEDLPEIHAVVLSHNHYDHFDLDTLKRLEESHSPLFFMGLKNSKLLEKHSIEAKTIEMDWGDSFNFKGPKENDIEVIFKPAQHWSARGVFDRNKMLWGSFVIKTKNHRVYFAGDTGHSKHFEIIGQEHGPFDLTLLPIGAYKPRWFMKVNHLNPEEAIMAHNELNSKKSMAIHFGTFQLSDEALYEPKFDLKRALREYKVNEDDFIVPKFGETYSF